MKSLRDAVIIIVVGALVGISVNAIRGAVHSRSLAWDTPWPDNRQKRQLDFPPSYEPGDSLLSVEDAYSIYLRGDAIFIDARESYEYDEGHIVGAVNFPFEQWDDYWQEVQPLLDPQREIVAYCGGLDCELSLFMARELKARGYDKSYIFFGGWQKWNDPHLPIEIPGGENVDSE